MADDIHCDVCDKGKYRRKKVERYDVSALVGLEGVALIGATALVCSSCGAVMAEGRVLEQVLDALSVMLVEQADPLAPGEVRYLRRVLDMTQEELAARLGTHRTTVARWEIGEAPIGQAESIAIRGLVGMQFVRERPSRAKEIATRFASPNTPHKVGTYEIRVDAA